MTKEFRRPWKTRPGVLDRLLRLLLVSVIVTASGFAGGCGDSGVSNPTHSSSVTAGSADSASPGSARGPAPGIAEASSATSGLMPRASISASGRAKASPEPDQEPPDYQDQLLEEAAVKGLNGREGAVLIMDPNTGRLRAVVNPSLAFEQALPPGSAIKPFTALAAMRSGLIDADTRIMCAGRYVTPGFQIVCSHPVSRSPFNLAHALGYSCNYYFATAAQRLSQGAFTSLLSSFGFGAATGIAPAEAAGILPRRSWQIKSALGEGSEILVTPIQLARAYVALLCGGHLFRPRAGSASGYVPETIANILVSERQRDVLVEGMRGAVTYGTAAKAGLASLPCYIFGKTGTSTASNGFRTQGWFVGLLSKGGPAAQPDLAVLVLLKRSHGADCASTARPVFEEYLRQTSQASDTGLPALFPGPPATLNQIIGNWLTASVAWQSSDHSSAAGGAPYRPQHQGDSIKVHLVSEKITRTLSLEQYCVGVLRTEASVEDRIEALKAQAVVSRTFALKNRGRHLSQGYDFCNTTHCQRYSGKAASPVREHMYERAVAETSGQVLLDDRGGLIDAYFHACCGGSTANIESLWGVPAPPYLKGVRDQYCRRMPNADWTCVIPLEKLARALESDPNTNVGPILKGVWVAARDDAGRARTVAIQGNRTVTVTGWNFKLVVGRALGWNFLKSSWFDITRSQDTLTFHGHGFGHGLGLCQEGAHVMAQRGSSYRQILSHYFPTTTVSTPNLPGAAYLDSMPAARMSLNVASSALIPKRVSLASIPPLIQAGWGF